MSITHLGAKVSVPEKPDKSILETFPCPGEGIQTVTFKTKEFTSLCPVTGQPDFIEVTISYIPKDLCLESKSLKLYLQSYRNERGFVEQLVNRIGTDIQDILQPEALTVSLTSVPRGGLGLTAIYRSFLCK